VVHGDLNLTNVLAADGAITGVLDWDDVGVGWRAADLAGLLFDWHRLRLAGAQLPQRLTRHDRRLAEVARRFPADRPLMLVAEDQGRIVGGALAFRTDPAPAAGGVTWTSSDSGASGGSPHASRDRPAAGRGDRRC